MAKKKYYEELGFGGDLLGTMKLVESAFNSVYKGTISMDDFIITNLAEVTDLTAGLTEREQYLFSFGCLMTSLAEQVD